MTGHRKFVGAIVVGLVVGAPTLGWAQEPAAEPAAPPAAEPAAPPAAEPAVAPPAVAPPGDGKPGEAKPGEEDKDKEKDGVRLRGGFSLNGGVRMLPENPVLYGLGFGLRLGVQFNHYFSLYYQNSPIITGTTNGSSSVNVGAFDYNSLLANLTLAHAFEIGAGPSIDYYALAGGSLTPGGTTIPGGPSIPSAKSSSASGIAVGAHGRIAFVIGGLSGNGPRRSGFAIGIDVHPMFLAEGKALTLTAGLGADWF